MMAVTIIEPGGGRMAIRGAALQTRARGLLLRAAATAIALAAAPLQAQTVTIRPIANISIPTKFSLKAREPSASARRSASGWVPG